MHEVPQEALEIYTIYQSMKLRIKGQRANHVVKNITHIHEQITKAKRIPATKSLNFTHISGNVLSSTPASSNTVGYEKQSLSRNNKRSNEQSAQPENDL